MTNKEILEAAKYGIQIQMDQLAAHMAVINSELGQMLNRPSDVTAHAAPAKQGGRKRKRLSAQTRARMAASQAKRWAAARADGHGVTKPRKTGKRRMSIAGRARIVEATKARWAAYRAAKAS